MYNIIRESIFNPKGIIKYHNKKGWFVFLYLFIMIFLLSLGSIVVLIAYENPTLNESSTGCVINSGEFVCSNEGEIETDIDLYGIPVYFLGENQDVNNVPLDETGAAIAIKDNYAYYVLSNFRSTGFDISEYNTFSELSKFLRTPILIGGIVFAFLQNLVIMLFIILVSTLPFLRFRKEIRYRKIFKMVTFAATPIAILLTIYNLLHFHMIIFFVLMFIAYRSVFTLQKELYYRSVIKDRYRENQKKNSEDESNEEDDNIIDQEEDEDK
ncbi:MAG: DUF1189 domain-containing protein [Candidatus Izimaplasma sp.]|nr:DUF1189 domain-containing protein [Candidatus Izimaplasma bacterium]